MNNEHFYRNLLDTVDDGIYFVNTDRKITFWNKGAERITDFMASEVIGSYCYDNILNHVDYSGVQLCLSGCPLQSTLEDSTVRDNYIYLQHKDGHRIPVSVKAMPVTESGVTVGAVEIFSDDRKESSILADMATLKLLANQDQLTNLPNRRSLESFLKARMDEFSSMDIPYGVVFMDIDNFKTFNDTYGHEIGDQVLKMVSKVFSGAKRNQDLIGRWGGEEFLGIFIDVNDNQLRNISERIRILVESSALRTSGEPLKVTISLGATMARVGEHFEEAVKRADSLLYKSKEYGRNRVILG